MQAIPSLVVFGPQITWPVGHSLAQLRYVLISEPHLSPIVSAIHELPTLWKQLVAFTPSLGQTDCPHSIQLLNAWIQGNASISFEDSPSNSLSAFLTIISHITQYYDFLKRGENLSHKVLREAVGARGFQGFCVGLLSAIVLHCAQSEDKIGTLGAVALRLAFCVGVFVDADQACNETATLLVRCAENLEFSAIKEIIDRQPEAYIAVRPDSNSLTTVVKKSLASNLTAKLQSHGFSAKLISPNGRFHSLAHRDVLQVLEKLSQSDEGMRFPSIPTCNAALMVNGRPYNSDEPLHQWVLRSILVEFCDWNSTMHESLTRSTAPDDAVLCIGRVSPISAHTINQYNVRIMRPERPIFGGDPSPNLQSKHTENSVAIIGMACKVPGADSLDEYWNIIRSGHSTGKTMPQGRFERGRNDRVASDEHSYFGNYVDDVEAFDNAFFGKSRREATSMDPQQRLLLQTAYQALASSGYFRGASPLPKDVGCYVGCGLSDYHDNVASHPPTAYSARGTLRAFLSGNISHYFGWTSPSMTFDTACSSSMVAIHTACTALKLNECSTALAGGVNIITSPYVFQNLAAASFLSPDGSSKAFDASANGYCRGEGVGLLVLKRLDRAMIDGDAVLAVIPGSGINQNLNSVPITVPHQESQVSLFRNVVLRAGIDPHEVSYVEAHGTGTQKGDPAEAASVRDVFGGPSRTDTVSLGSVKSNIGHLEGAAGVAGVIKVVLMMQHKVIPPQANFSSLNPAIAPLEKDRMQIATVPQEWTTKYRMACVNSYGASGSNAAAIVCEASPTNSLPSYQLEQYPIYISAFSASALAANCRILEDWLQNPSRKFRLSDLAFNLTRKQNSNLPHITSAVVSSFEDLTRHLRTVSLQATENPDAFKKQTIDKPLILIFGGQEGNRVYFDEKAFRASAGLQLHLSHCEKVLRGLGLKSLFPSIFEKGLIHDTVHHHVVLFCLQYAAAKTWIESGLQPTVVIGHSFGQLTAMCVAGYLRLEDGLRLISGRATLLSQLVGKDQGCMIALEADLDTVHALISAVGLDLPDQRPEIACYNGLNSFVIAGTPRAISKLEEAVQAGRFRGRVPRLKRLQVPYAFHSQLIEPIMSGYSQLCNSVTFSKSVIRLETCTESPHMNDITSDTLIRHSREPVYFHQAVQRLAEELGPSVWLEAGSGSSITSMVRRSLGSDVGSQHTLLPITLDEPRFAFSLSEASLSLWSQNHQHTFWPFQEGEKNHTNLMLPPYQFDKPRHWLMHRSPTEGAIQDLPAEKLELLVFESFEDREKRIARFTINPKHDRFQLLACGHSVLGTPLCPASLYVDLVTQAAAHPSVRTAGQQARELNVSIYDLRILAPLGATTDSTISLTLHKDVVKAHSWSFTISATLNNSQGHLKATDNVTGRFELAEPASFTNFNLLSRVVKLPDWQNLNNSTDVQKVQGPVIYTLFDSIVNYSTIYRGVKDVTTYGSEALATVRMPRHDQESIARVFCDPLEIDNFLQVAGLHVNCLRGQVGNDVFLATGVESLQFDQQMGHDNPEQVWFVHAISKDISPTELVSDLFVFDPRSHRLYMLISGVRFRKVNAAPLSKALRSANGTSTTFRTVQTLRSTASVTVSAKDVEQLPLSGVEEPPAPVTSGKDNVTAAFSKNEAGQSQNICISKLSALLCDVGDIPQTSIDVSKSVEELGIDSLMMTEILSEIQTRFGVAIAMADFQNSQSIQHLCHHLSHEPSEASTTSPSLVSLHLSDEDSTSYATTPLGRNSPAPSFRPTENEEQVSVKLQPLYAKSVFHKHQDSFEKYARETGFFGFWTEVYPKQLQLVVPYIVQALGSLGCDLSHMSPGDIVPKVQTLGIHRQLLHRLFEILEEANIVQIHDSQITRANQPIPSYQTQELHDDLMQVFPQHASEHKLLKVTGERLADCLVGRTDAVQLLFSRAETRDLLADVYASSPMFSTPTTQLGDFLPEALIQASTQGPVHILELGAGTGGTTSHIIQRLHERGIRFHYTFTDISQSMVAKARKRFGPETSMDFRVLDIEQDAPRDLEGKFHAVISSNCIHATRSITTSMQHVRQMLRPDGFVAVIELTRQVAWLDLVFGLLDGWWRFDDGRKHALAHELFWERSLRAAGYGHINWTDAAGNRESQTIRIIVAFPPKRSTIGSSSSSDSSSFFRATSILLQGHASARKKIFAFPGGFGTSATYAPLPLLSRDAVLYGLNSPFVKAPSEYDVPLDEFAAYYVEEMKRVQPRGPYIIMGYSAGGVVAYEAARQLVQAGSAVEHLLLLDSACPLLVPPFPLSLLAFFESIDRFSGRERGAEGGGGGGGVGDRAMTDPHVVATLESLRLYSLRALADDDGSGSGSGSGGIKTTLFAARSGVDKQRTVQRPVVSAEEEKVLTWVLDDRDLARSTGWERLVGGGVADFAVVPVGGNHFSLMKEPHINDLAAEIVTALSL